MVFSFQPIAVVLAHALLSLHTHLYPNSECSFSQYLCCPSIQQDDLDPAPLVGSLPMLDQTPALYSQDQGAAPAYIAPLPSSTHPFIQDGSWLLPPWGSPALWEQIFEYFLFGLRLNCHPLCHSTPLWSSESCTEWSSFESYFYTVENYSLKILKPELFWSEQQNMWSVGCSY